MQTLLAVFGGMLSPVCRSVQSKVLRNIWGPVKLRIFAATHVWHIYDGTAMLSSW